MGYMIDTGCQAVRLIITAGQIIAWCEGDTGVWALTMILYNEADATDHWKIIYVNIKIIGCLRIKNHDIDWKHGRHLMGLQSSSVIFLTMFKTFAVGWIFFSSGELNAIHSCELRHCAVNFRYQFDSLIRFDIKIKIARRGKMTQNRAIVRDKSLKNAADGNGPNYGLNSFRF